MAVLAVAFGFAVFIAAFCRLADVNVTPFRAESGWFIARAWATGERMDFIQPFLFKAYNGHYTPLFFSLEFLQARLFGANALLWFARQMLVLGLLATSLSLLCRSACAFGDLSRGTVRTLSATFPLIFILQPTVLELAAWPFMAAQLLCLACASMSACHALRLIRSSCRRDATLSLAWAYGSMHLFGIGLTFSATALVVITAIIWAQRLPARFLAPVAAFAAATCIHAVLMTTNGSPSLAEPQTLSTSLERFGALYMGSVQSGARSLWANGRFPWPNPATYDVDAVYGIALMTCMVTVFGVLLWRARKLQRPDLLFVLVIIALPALTLPVYCSLIIFRLHTVADPNAIAPYLFGTRYLVFPAFFLFTALLVALPPAARLLGRGLAVLSAMLATGAGAATIVFFASVATLWPYMNVKPSEEWNKVVSQARTERASLGYVVDRPMDALDPELRRNLSEFRGLLDAEMDCQECVRFSPR